MKTLAMLAFAIVSLAGCAANRSAPIAETGYAPGALAVAAIERGDWARAEQLLTETAAPTRTIRPG